MTTEKKVLELDLQEFEKTIYPKYKEIVSNIPLQKAKIEKNSQKLRTVFDKHGEDLHREIESYVQKLKSDLN